MREIFESFPVFIIIVLILALIVFGPLVLIWALNTLFTLGIPYTFKTWLASLIIGGYLSNGSSKGSK